jgi:hypothetical protein
MPKVLAAAIGVLIIVGARPALGSLTPPQRCAAAKLKAAGKEVAAKTACHAKAKARATIVEPGCLANAQARADAAIARAGSIDCAGDAAAIDAAVDQCVAIYVGDAPGDGKCPSASLKAIGKGAGALLTCSSREVKKAGIYAECDARVDVRLERSLARAGGCVALSTTEHNHVHGCDSDVKQIVLPPATTTSSPVVSTSSTTASSVTTTTGAVLCGNGVIDPGEECDGPGLGGCIEGLYAACEGCQCCIGENGRCGDTAWNCCGAAECHYTGPGVGICTVACLPPGGPCGAYPIPCCGFPCHPNGFCP